ncbi:hypothetical protein MHU86_24769 [Fragilaria crotonensis]|nr:hypothetical protein MHU86_24769 [Fragilaria crotonensis]
MPVSDENSKFVRHFTTWIIKRYKIRRLLIKMEYEMHRWCTCQSRLKTRSSSAILLIASLIDFELDYFW